MEVNEELVRQNGNQAAAVMVDYASQGSGGDGDSPDTNRVRTTEWVTGTQNVRYVVDIITVYMCPSRLKGFDESSLRYEVYDGDTTTEDEAQSELLKRVKKFVEWYNSLSGYYEPVLKPFDHVSMPSYVNVLYSSPNLRAMNYSLSEDDYSVEINSMEVEDGTVFYVSRVADELSSYGAIYEAVADTEQGTVTSGFVFAAIPYKSIEAIFLEGRMAVNAKNTVYVDYVEGETSFELPSDLTAVAIRTMVDGYCLMPNVVLRKKDSESTSFIEAFHANNIRVTKGSIDQADPSGPQLTATYLEISFSGTQLDSYTTVTAVVSYGRDGTLSECTIYEGEL